MMKKSIEEIVRMGCARLERARAGEDFFQAVPAVAVGDDLVAWYLQAFGRVIFMAGGNGSGKSTFPQPKRLIAGREGA